MKIDEDACERGQNITTVVAVYFLLQFWISSIEMRNDMSH